MNKELQVFNHPDFGEMRELTINGEPWFVGKDVARVLGYSNTKDALHRHVDAEDKMQNDEVVILDPMGREQYPTIINESGLYSLILSSKLPRAKAFKRWVTSEVLPALRKTGSYSHEQHSRTLTVDDYLKAASIVATCRNERLSYVLSYLEQAGFRNQTVEVENQKSEAPHKAVECMRRVKQAKDLNNVQLGRMIGVDWVQVSRYMNGQALPSLARALFIIDVLEKEVNKI